MCTTKCLVVIFFPANIWRNHVPKRLIIAGAPASGKGTQCELIKAKYGVKHISTGDILRDAVKAGTELGKKAAGYMNEGKLVPDDLIIGIMKAQLEDKSVQESGWLLDGFPRTPAQAEALISAGITADAFIVLDVPDDILVERVEGRRLDPVSGKIYHLKFNPPPEDDRPLKVRLIQREDDTAEKIKVRLVGFHDNIKSVMNQFNDVMFRINGAMDKNEVFRHIEYNLD